MFSNVFSARAALRALCWVEVLAGASKPLEEITETKTNNEAHALQATTLLIFLR